MKFKLTILFLIGFFVTNGQCDIGNCQNGYGRYRFSDGTVYLGKFVNGKLNGSGMIIYNSGNYHVGYFTNNKSHGLGFYTYNGNRISSGYFHEGKKHGEFVETMPMGDCAVVTYYYGQVVKENYYYRDCYSLIAEVSRSRDNFGYQIMDVLGINK
jgi:hypothetical protein